MARLRSVHLSTVLATVVGALWALSAGVAAGAADVPVVFASRDLRVDPDSAVRPAAIEKATSGRLLVREAAGALRVLVDGTKDAAALIDVMDPDVSWGGDRVVFSGYSRTERAWRIYEVNADGSGLRQVTRSDRQLDLTPFGAAASALRGYDDVDPAYLPDGRIVFVSTRYPVVAPDGRKRGTNLYVVNEDGSDLHRITTERFGADTPAIDPVTGKIVYSRWWRSAIFGVTPSGEEDPDDPTVPPGSPGYGDLEPMPVDGEPLPPVSRALTDEEFPGLNSWFLADINPDGSGMAMLAGVGLDRELTQAWRPTFDRDGTIYALFIPRTPFLGLPRGDGLRTVRRGAAPPDALGGPQTFDFGEEPIDRIYASADVLPDGRLIVSATSPDSGDYDLHLQDAGGKLQPLHRIPGTWEVGAVPLEPRPVPPIIRDRVKLRLSDQPPATVEEAFERGGKFTFVVENIFGNASIGVPVGNAPPAVEGLAIEFYMNPQRTGLATPDEPVLIARRDIDRTGRIEVELPGGVSLFEMLRTSDNRIPVGRDGQVFHVGGHNFGLAGEQARCIGCHVGHSMLPVPAGFQWTNMAPSADIIASSSRRTPLTDLVLVQRPENLLDRRTGDVRSEWAAETRSASLELRWEQPIRAREIVLYAPPSGDGERPRLDQQIRSVRVISLLGREVRSRGVVEGPIAVTGTSLALDASRAIDRLQLVIHEENVSGSYGGKPGVAMAEIEVIGRVSEGDTPIAFIRGDSNCDGQTEISDAVTTLDWLFKTGGVLCCSAAADADSTGVIDLTDAIYLLNFLFGGGREPASPYPGCGLSERETLSCDGPTSCSE